MYYIANQNDMKVVSILWFFNASLFLNDFMRKDGFDCQKIENTKTIFFHINYLNEIDLNGQFELVPKNVFGIKKYVTKF